MCRPERSRSKSYIPCQLMDMSLKGILCKSADFSDTEINLPIRFSCCKNNITESVEASNPPEITMRSNTTTRQAAKQIERTVQLEPHKSAAAQRRQSVRRH